MSEDGNKQVTWLSIFESVGNSSQSTFTSALVNYPIPTCLGTLGTLFLTGRAINRSEKKYYILGGLGALSAFGVFRLYRRYHAQLMQLKEQWSMFNSISSNPNRASSIVNKQQSYNNASNHNYNNNTFNGVLRNVTISANSTFSALQGPIEHIFQSNNLKVVMTQLMASNKDTVCVLNSLRASVVGRTVCMILVTSFLRIFLRLSYGVINRHLVADLAYKSKAGNTAVDACVRTLEDATRDILNVSYNIQTDVVLPVVAQIVMQQLLTSNNAILADAGNTWMSSKIEKEECRDLLQSLAVHALSQMSHPVDPAAATDGSMPADIKETDALARLSATKQRKLDQPRIDAQFLLLTNKLFLEKHVFGGRIVDANGYRSAAGLQNSPFGCKGQVITNQVQDAIASGESYDAVQAMGACNDDAFSKDSVQLILRNQGKDVSGNSEHSTSQLAHMLLPLPILLLLLQAHADTLPDELVLRPHNFPGSEETAPLRAVYLWRAHAILGELFVLLRSPVLMQCISAAVDAGTRHVIDLLPSMEAGAIRMVTGLMKLDSILWPDCVNRPDVTPPNALLAAMDRDDKISLAATKAVYMPIGVNENSLGGEIGVTPSSEAALLKEFEMLLGGDDAPDLKALLGRQPGAGAAMGPGVDEDFLKLFKPKKKLKSKKKPAIKKSD